MRPYARKTSLLLKSSRKETTCIDGNEAVFAPLLSRAPPGDPVAADWDVP